MNQAKQSPIYLAGRSAALQGLTYAACPYSGDDKREWQRGFNVGKLKLRTIRNAGREQQHA